MVLERIANRRLHDSPEMVEQQKMAEEQAAAERARQAQEQLESDAISETVRLQLDHALRTAKTDFIPMSNKVARTLFGAMELKMRTQRVLNGEVPTETGAVNVEVRGLYPEGINPTNETPFDAIVITFPGASNEAYTLSEGRYHAGYLRQDSLFPNTADWPRLQRGNKPMGTKQKIPLSDAIHLRDNVVMPLLQNAAHEAQSIATFTSPSRPEGV